MYIYMFVGLTCTYLHVSGQAPMLCSIYAHCVSVFINYAYNYVIVCDLSTHSMVTVGLIHVF